MVIAAAAVVAGVPVPSQSIVIFLSCVLVPLGAETPDTAMESRILTTEAGVRLEQPSQVSRKHWFAGVPVQLSNMFAGKEVRDEQLRQAR